MTAADNVGPIAMAAEPPADDEAGSAVAVPHERQRLMRRRSSFMHHVMVDESSESGKVYRAYMAPLFCAGVALGAVMTVVGARACADDGHKPLQWVLALAGPYVLAVSAVHLAAICARDASLLRALDSGVTLALQFVDVVLLVLAQWLLFGKEERYHAALKYTAAAFIAFEYVMLACSACLVELFSDDVKAWMVARGWVRERDADDGDVYTFAAVSP